MTINSPIEGAVIEYQNGTHSAPVSYAIVSQADEVAGKWNRTLEKCQALRYCKYYAPASAAITLGSNGYTTFASTSSLDLTAANLPDGVKAYKAAVDGEIVRFTEVNEAVQANTGILVEGAPNGTVNIPIAASGSDISSSNDFLVNTTGNTFSGDDDYYYFVLYKNSNPLEFWTIDPNTIAIPAQKAYLKVEKASLGASSRMLAVSFDDEPLSITSVTTENGDGPVGIYNLQGQLLATPKKGLNIRNGKKVFVR
jgi:hypothetical protein